jgi:trehalose 6-phosphate phosphatase
MLTLHYRSAANAPRAAREIERLADEIASRHGLVMVAARSSIELRPPIAFTKAAVVKDRSEELGLAVAAFVGDDRVDLPAFDALDELASEGVATVRIAVRSDQAPGELLRRADVIVEGPHGALEFLRALA